MIKRYMISCYTDWCDTDAEYIVEAKSLKSLSNLADSLALDNLLSYDFIDEMLSDYIDYDENGDEIIPDPSIIEYSNYYHYNIREVENTDDTSDAIEIEFLDRRVMVISLNGDHEYYIYKDILNKDGLLNILSNTDNKLIIVNTSESEVVKELIDEINEDKDNDFYVSIVIPEV